MCTRAVCWVSEETVMSIWYLPLDFVPSFSLAVTRGVESLIFCSPWSAFTRSSCSAGSVALGDTQWVPTTKPQVRTALSTAARPAHCNTSTVPLHCLPGDVHGLQFLRKPALDMAVTPPPYTSSHGAPPHPSSPDLYIFTFFVKLFVPGHMISSPGFIRCFRDSFLRFPFV